MHSWIWASSAVPCRCRAKGDRLVVSADFIRPVYLYLIAVNPDGSWQNIEPPAASLPSVKQATSFRHPSGNQYLTLDDPGFTALILLASSQPLAPDAASSPEIDKDVWRSTSVAVPWSYDGSRLDPLTRQRIGTAEHGPRPFLDLCRAMASRQEVVAIRATAFSVVEGDGR